MINKQDIKHIAKLARLGLTIKEIETYQKDLSSILDYIEKLKEADISKIEPTSHSVKIENVDREDVGSKRQEAGNRKLMELAPETKQGFLKVKSIFK